MENLNEHIEVISRFKKSLVREYQNLESWDMVSQHSDFKNEIENKVEEIQALEGPLYTEIGKNAAITEEVTKLRNKHLALTRDKAQEANKNLKSFLEKIETEISIREQSNLSPEAINRMQYRNNEFLGEVQSTLSLIGKAEKLDSYVSNIFKKSENDIDLSRFLSKNYYHFVQKAKEIADGPERISIIARIQASVEEADERCSTPKLRALKAMKQEMENKFYNPPSVLIQNTANSYTRKYK